MDSADESDLVKANAKRLRSSSDNSVCEGVYINRHLTVAESRAAYELRCQRRQSAQQRSTRSTHQVGLSSSGELSMTESCHLKQQHEARSTKHQRQQHQQHQQQQQQQLRPLSSGIKPLVSSKSQLNATVPSFQPIAPIIPTNN